MNDTLKRIAILVAALVPVAVIAVLVMRDTSESIAPSLSADDVGKTEQVARDRDDEKPEPSSPAAETGTPAAAPVAGTPTSVAVSVTEAPSTVPVTPQTFDYTDGTYNATGTYRSPAGMESVAITVVLKSDIIAEVSFTGTSQNSTSQGFINMFSSGYKALVVGKNIDDVQLSKVSGSSLTPKGFNEALNAIKTQAEV